MGRRTLATAEAPETRATETATLTLEESYPDGPDAAGSEALFASKALGDAFDARNLAGKARTLVAALRRRPAGEETAPADPGPGSKAIQRPLAAKAVIGNLVITKNEVTAWFTVPARSDSFRSIRYVETKISDEAEALAGLTRRRVHLRTSLRPHPVETWAKKTWDDAAAAAEKGDAKPLPGFGDFLVRQQEVMAEASFSHKWCYLGVRIAKHRAHPLDPYREAEAHAEALEALESYLSSGELAAFPSSKVSMEWLMRRSVGLGLPMVEIGTVADYTGPGDIAELDVHASWTAEPFEDHILVTGEPTAEGTPSAFVTILSLGRLTDQDIPRQISSGWMQRADETGFETEWSAFFDVEEEEKTQAWIRGRLRLLDGQADHYAEHRADIPAHMGRQRQTARGIQADLDSDHGGRARRIKGWFRVAVAAPDLQELRRRVDALKAVYGSKAQLVRMPAQYAAAREFIPGEGLSADIYGRRMSVVSLAAAIPHGTSIVGDTYGHPLGYSSGAGRAAVAWPSHQAMESGRSGLTVICGEQGAGKTFVLGFICYLEALSGAEVIIFDPSARLGELTRLPDLKDFSREVNIFHGEPGRLCPYAVVQDPVPPAAGAPEHVLRKYELDLAEAEGTRIALAKDVIAALDPSYAEDRSVRAVVNRALDAVPPVRTSGVEDVATVLEALGRGESPDGAAPELGDRALAASDTARALRQAAKSPIGRLVVPRATAEDADAEVPRLTVYTLAGITFPKDGKPASELDTQALLAVRLAAFLVQARIYRSKPSTRKCLAMDEGQVMMSFPVVEALIGKTSTDTRKHNLRFLLSSQDLAHLDFSDSPDSLGNQIRAAFVGHTESETAVSAALKVLRAPEGEGYEEIISTLRKRSDKRAQSEETQSEGTQLDDARKPRRVVFFDGTASEVIVIDASAHPDLLKALDTNPGAAA